MPEQIAFFSQGTKLVGRLWLPALPPPPGGFPAVIVTGSWLTVQEQMPAEYAPRLAEAGIAAMTFDFKGFGKSGGEPRDLESPSGKAEDLRNAAAYLSTHPAIAADRIGSLAICASAGYAAAVSRGSAHLRSLVLIAPWLHDAEIVASLYGGAEAIAARNEQAAAARAHYARSGQVRYVAAASNTDPDAAMYAPGDIFDYYLNPQRGVVPEWSNRFALMSWTEWLDYDAIAIAKNVTVPVRIVTSEASATPTGARKFEANLRGKHDSVWITGTQFDFYDDPKTVELATAHAVAHFRSTLA